MSDQEHKDDRPAQPQADDQAVGVDVQAGAGIEEGPEGEAEEAPAGEVEQQVDGEAELPEDGPTQAAVVVGPPPEPAEAAGEPQPKPQAPERIAGVCLADGKVFDFDPGKLDLQIGDQVVVSNDRDLNLGRIRYLVPNRSGKHLRKVLRRVGPHDLLLMRRNTKREEEAFEYCAQRIAERKLPMKLVQAAFLHGGNKAIFFFTADGRVDFRALVRDLAQQLHVRIEMRQIGVRDEAKLLGGIGICGQPLCCARYLKKFVPVSIKMAKNQGLALNPQKVSGLCGRLMCCLVYEDDVYRELHKGFPRMGKTIETPGGSGKVVEADVLAGRVRVVSEEGYVTYTIGQLRGEEEVPPPSPERIRRKASGRQRPEDRKAGGRQRAEDRKAAGRQRTEERKTAGRPGADEADAPAKAEPEGADRRGAKRRRRRKPSRSAGAQNDKVAGARADKAAEAPTEGAAGQAADARGAAEQDAQTNAKRKKRRRRSRRRRKRSKDGNKADGQGSSDGA